MPGNARGQTFRAVLEQRQHGFNRGQIVASFQLDPSMRNDGDPGARGIEDVPSVPGVVEVDVQLLAQWHRAGEANGDAPHAPGRTAQDLHDAPSAQGHGAQAVQEDPVGTAPTSRLDVEVMGGPVTRGDGVPAGHVGVDVLAPLTNRVGACAVGKEVTRRGTADGLAGDPQPDGRPPLLGHEPAAGVEREVAEGDRDVAAGRAGPGALDLGGEGLVRDEWPVQHDVVLAVDAAHRGLPE